MAKFHSRDLAELTRQLTYAPSARRLEQIDRAEQLYWQTDPQLNYPLEYVAWRITRYRLDTVEEVMLTGRAVRHDLLLLVRQLSSSLGLTADAYDPPPVGSSELAVRLKITPKTLSRYQQAGLFCRRIADASGRRRTVFLPAGIERFLSHQSRHSRAGRGFCRMDPGVRGRILERARRLSHRVETTPFAVARHLSRKYPCTAEAIRLLLINHDRRHPREAIFPRHTGSLSDKQQRLIHRAYLRGISVARLAERFGRARTAIYRTVNLRRAAALSQLTIRFISSPTFERPDAQEVILGPGIGTQGPLDAKTEAALFTRYNYLKFSASELRSRLDPAHPSSIRIDQIETHLRHAATLKQILTGHYLRLVESVARKHLAGQTAAGGDPIADLIGLGNLVLMEAIETFDAGRGSRFSTYLTWALMRRFAHRRAEERLTGGSMALDSTPATASQVNADLAALERQEETASTLAKLLATLGERERLLLIRRFGLKGSGHADLSSPIPQTLAQVAGELKISAERARQIERKALAKLRDSAQSLGVSLGGLELET